jgi:hypothetical protein
MRCCGRCSRRGPLREASRRTSPKRAGEGLSIPTGGRRIRPHHGIRRLRLSRKCLTVLRVPHPSRRRISRRIAAFEFLGSLPFLRRSKGVSGSNSLLPLRLVGRRTRARAQSVAPWRRLQDHSASTLRLLSRRMLRALFQMNLALLEWFRSSGLINLLVVHLGASDDSLSPSLLNHGPQRASNAAHGPNCFLLRPTAFHYMAPQGSGEITVRGLAAASGLFVSNLRAANFLALFAASAVLLRIPASQGDSAIERPNVSSLEEAPLGTEAHGLTPLDARAAAPHRARTGVGFFHAR